MLCSLLLSPVAHPPPRTLSTFISSGLFWLLLPVVAGVGWWFGRHATRRPSPLTGSGYSRDYFRGLDYILDEQPDKAVEIFISMLEHYADTTEIHWVLGKLFRRCGELDRAIHVHQSLLSRAGLTEQQRLLFTYELGVDYLRAGLLGRAEDLFREVVDSGHGGTHVGASLTGLLELYQQEQDWEKAILTARQLQKYRRQGTGLMIAQFYCQQAELARTHAADERACLEQAKAADPKCVRASLAEARLLAEDKQLERAISTLQHVEHQDPDFLPEIIPPLLQSYQGLKRLDSGLEYLRQVYSRRGGISMLMVLARHIAAAEGDEAAMHYLAAELRKHPSVRGVNLLLQYMVGVADGSTREELGVVHEIIARFLEHEPMYRCRQCGFRAHTLHWQCPGCRDWSVVKPVREADAA